MLWVPQKGVLRVQHNIAAVSADLVGTSVTTGATSSTKGTPAEIFASTSFDAYWIVIMAGRYANAATASDCCVDLLAGAAAEEVIIPNLLAGEAYGGVGAAACGYKQWAFPLYIPAGTRIAAQAAGLRTSTIIDIIVCLYGGHGYPPFRVGGNVTTYGIGTVPAGTTVTPGASGAEGAWAEIVASTTRDHFAVIPSFQLNDSTMNLRRLVMDLGLGAAAAEEPIGGSYVFKTDGTETMEGPWPAMPCFQDIPSGTRLAVRASNNGTNDNGTYNVALHCMS